MTNLPLAELFGIEWLFWWQLPLVLVVAVLIIFLVMYRRRQY